MHRRWLIVHGAALTIVLALGIKTLVVHNKVQNRERELGAMLEEIDVLRANNRKLQILEQELLELRELQVQMLRLAGIERALGVDLDLLNALQEASLDTLQQSSGLVLWPVAGAEIQDGTEAAGVRLFAEPGRTVVASGDGVVDELSLGTPGFIRISHQGGFETAYRNIGLALVDAGDSVLTGQIVGLVGQDGSYLQFEVHRDGYAVRPQDYVHQNLPEGSSQ